MTNLRFPWFNEEEGGEFIDLEERLEQWLEDQQEDQGE